MFDWTLNIVYAILVFGLLVLFHELGHFVLAKMSGVQVYEFSIGFGPRIAGIKRGETEYSLRSIPLGGYVRMAGMDPDEDKREATPDQVVSPEKSFMHKSVSKRIGIIAAGPLMNFVLAFLLFSLSIFFFGYPTLKNVVGGVLKDKPAVKMGIKQGDVIKTINNELVEDWDDVVSIIRDKPGSMIAVKIVRGKETRVFNITPEKDAKTGLGIIGITPVPTPIYMHKGVIQSFKLGGYQTYRVLYMTKEFIKKMIAKQMPVQLSGPVRITYELGKAAEMGFNNLLDFAGILSMQIGIFNLLPIPALDGSRILFLGLEGIRGIPIDPSKENFIHLVGLALLLLLMVVITYQDILQMIG
jgi:regulator of sigma E protease